MIQQDIGDASDLWSVSTPVVIVCPVLVIIINPAAILSLSFIISFTCRFASVAWRSFEIDADFVNVFVWKNIN